MKKHLLTFLALGLLAYAQNATAQTTILYGRPAAWHPNGDITCGDNDEVCAKIIKDPGVVERTSGTTSTAVDRTPDSEKVTVVAYTQQGPISFDAAPGYSVAKGNRSVYHFKKLSPARRVIYRNQ